MTTPAMSRRGTKPFLNSLRAYLTRHGIEKIIVRFRIEYRDRQRPFSISGHGLDYGERTLHNRVNGGTTFSLDTFRAAAHLAVCEFTDFVQLFAARFVTRRRGTADHGYKLGVMRTHSVCQHFARGS